MSQPGMCAQMPLRDMVGECSRNVMRMAQEMRNTAEESAFGHVCRRCSFGIPRQRFFEGPGV